MDCIVSAPWWYSALAAFGAMSLVSLPLYALIRWVETWAEEEEESHERV